MVHEAKRFLDELAGFEAQLLEDGYHFSDQGIVGSVSPPARMPVKISDDPKFARRAIDEARKSIAEADGRPHPKVGAVVVKNGQILATAHRGEAAGNHAEFIALEKRLPDAAVAGATVYTTLEPCTTRNHPKIPCAERLIERRVARVVIGMLDPDPRITGRGQRKLRSANVTTDFFPPDLMAEVEELNRNFIRFFECQDATQQPSSQGVAQQLRQLAAEKKTVLIRPVIPPQYRNPDFQIDAFHPNQVVIRKLSTSHMVSIPLTRVSEILWGFPNELPTLILNGRIQWVTIPMEWRFFAEVAPSGEEEYLGLPKNVAGPQDPYVKQIERELSETSYEAHWFRRENLHTSSSGVWPPQDWQPFYDGDGRYLVYRHGHEALILSVRIRK
jgi:pyrimidine deaminase RibD-like protein